MEWVIKKRKSFDQRGEMAASAWAEQQMRDLNLKARRGARDKVLEHNFSMFPALISVADTKVEISLESIPSFHLVFLH